MPKPVRPVLSAAALPTRAGVAKAKAMAMAMAATDADALRSWLAVVRAYNLCDTLLSQRLAALGVRTPEHEILANLRREPGITQQALAERCFSAKSHISALLVTLERRQWVRREADPADARVKRLYVAAAGERMVVKTAAVQAEVVAVMADAVAAEELALVADVMGRVSERLVLMLA